MCKYDRMQRNTSPWLVRSSHGACLDCMLPGVQVSTGLGFFLHPSHLYDYEDCDSLPVNAYIDDILIASNTTDEHAQHLRAVFECFKQYSVNINSSK